MTFTVENVKQERNSEDGRLSQTESRKPGTSEDIHDNGETLERGFKSRHVNMFAIAESIGTGLIIGSGQALASGGPGSLLILYLVMGSCVYFVMTALAEMAVFAPMDKGFSGYATRYTDPALG